MVDHTEKRNWRAEFITSITITLKDSRLWLVVLPALVVCAVAIALFRPVLATLVSSAVLLLAGHLLNRIETLPRPDGKELAEGLYRTLVFPATVGALIITNSDLFARVWFMPWHWFHSNDATPSCSKILSTVLIAWLGVPFAAAVTALLTRDRAIFATMVGLTLHIPLTLTDSLSDKALSAALLFAKSCHLDDDMSDASGIAGFHDGFGIGVAFSILTHALITIFVAKLVSTWLARKNV